jgi:hypothetical protein
MTVREQITLRRRGQRGNPGYEAYRVEKLHNRREPVVGSDLTPETVDQLILRCGKPCHGAFLTVTILDCK